jgi:hypothetical protein
LEKYLNKNIEKEEIKIKKVMYSHKARKRAAVEEISKY